MNRATFGKNKTEKFTSLNILGAQTSAHTGGGNSEEEDLEEMKNDPQAHFKKLKAKIKLKCVKQYQEDKLKQKEEEERAKQPVVIIKDKLGRVMEMKKPIMRNKKKPSANRKPIKKKPPKRLRSFTEIQLKFYADEDIYNPMQDQPKPTLTDKYIIDMMKEADRFPIPESLVGRRKNQKKPYVLKIDSLISAAFKIEEVNEWAN